MVKDAKDLDDGITVAVDFATVDSTDGVFANVLAYPFDLLSP